MVKKFKEKYLPEEYEIQMHKKRKILKQKDIDVASHTEEFQRLYLRSKIQEKEVVKVVRYLGGLRWDIQEEISLWTCTTVQKCFQLALMVEEMNKKKQEYHARVFGRGRDGRGTHRGRDGDSKSQGDSKSNEKNGDSSSRGNYRRGRGFKNGGRSSHLTTMKCYNCGNLGHPTYRCLEKDSSSQGERKVNYVQEDQGSNINREVNLDLV